ncbi:hypothetical protein AMECASPLE_001521 [Ameca splendens]|uniref:Uncharacterized protein n=1 Tax=Ameca splendens TaxID=208324 RepID=A0ABV0YXB6_9TELE
MDFGVGAFIFANALVSPEARRRSVSGSKMSHITKQILSVWPLVALGMARLVVCCCMLLCSYVRHSWSQSLVAQRIYPSSSGVLLSLCFSCPVLVWLIWLYSSQKEHAAVVFYRRQ